MNSRFRWQPYSRERVGFSCDRDAPNLWPCGLGHCSACTDRLAAAIGPQMEREIDPERWGRLTLIYREHSRFTDSGLRTRRFEFLKDVLRRKIKAAGLGHVRILGKFDINREDVIIDRRFTGYHWSVHVHGAIEIVGNVPTMIAMLHTQFPPTAEIPEPVRIEEFERTVAEWIAYFLKDPAHIRKYLRFRWTPRPKGNSRPRKKSRDAQSGRLRTSRKTPRWRMTEREAEPLMALLAAHDVEDQLFLQGYTFRKDNWKLSRIRSSQSKAEIGHPTQGPTRPMVPSGSVKTRSAGQTPAWNGYPLYRASLQRQVRFREFMKRNGARQPPRPRKPRPLN